MEMVEAELERLPDSLVSSAEKWPESKSDGEERGNFPSQGSLHGSLACSQFSKGTINSLWNLSISFSVTNLRVVFSGFLEEKELACLPEKAIL